MLSIRSTARANSDGTMNKQEAFHEIKTNPPAILAKTRKKKGAEAARKQAIAIALSKASLSKPGKK
jgi:hypothetical protein